jgi:uncharacterized protein YndB with AHSA1/START domain
MPEVGSTGSGDARATDENPPPIEGELGRQPRSYIANVPEERMYTWDSQAAQYPPTGPPGFSYVRGDVSDEIYVDCLLYRDETGKLIGILNRYPMDIPPLEREGDQTIWVHPDHRRQGIGSTLSTEAFVRWGPSPNVSDPKLTESGVRLARGMEEKRSIVRRVLPAPPDVVYDEWLDAQKMLAWMCPRPAVPTRIEIDPQVGGHYRIDIDNEGLARIVTGRYLVLDIPRLSFTWHSSTWAPSAPESVVFVQLQLHDRGRTLMTIRHGRLPPGGRAEYEPGWARVAAQLEEHLTSR